MISVVGIQQLKPSIVQITMQDEEHKNTFSTELAQGLIQVFEAIKNNPNYKVVILLPSHLKRIPSIFKFFIKLPKNECISINTYTRGYFFQLSC
ncbi:MAG: enoyl-CoA hydratase-related protein [Pseudomonadales bacterium]